MEVDDVKAFLVKKRLDDEVAEEIRKACGVSQGEAHQRLLDIASAVYGARKAADRDIDFLSSRRDEIEVLLGEELLDEVMAQLEEIADDLEWSVAEHGKLIIAANEYVAPFFKEFRADARFEDVYIGAHLYELAIMIQGNVKAAEDLESLQALIARYPAPYPLMWRVDVARSSAAPIA